MTVRWTVRAESDRAPQCENSNPYSPAKRDCLTKRSESVSFYFPVLNFRKQVFYRSIIFKIYIARLFAE